MEAATSGASTHHVELELRACRLCILIIILILIIIITIVIIIDTDVHGLGGSTDLVADHKHRRGVHVHFSQRRRVAPVPPPSSLTENEHLVPLPQHHLSGFLSFGGFGSEMFRGAGLRGWSWDVRAGVYVGALDARRTLLALILQHPRRPIPAHSTQRRQEQHTESIFSEITGGRSGTGWRPRWGSRSGEVRRRRASAALALPLRSPPPATSEPDVKRAGAGIEHVESVENVERAGRTVSSMRRKRESRMRRESVEKESTEKVKTASRWARGPRLRTRSTTSRSTRVQRNSMESADRASRTHEMTASRVEMIASRMGDQLRETEDDDARIEGLRTSPC
eukprot:2493754-Rhodomonas_salina.3